jgi:hypothetical protein
VADDLNVSTVYKFWEPPSPETLTASPGLQEDSFNVTK